MSENQPPTNRPIVAPEGASPAAASHPNTTLDPAYQIYETHPAPWWIAALWLSYFIFGLTYLILNLLR